MDLYKWVGTWFICLTTRFLTRRLNYISCSIFRIFQPWVPYLNFPKLPPFSFLLQFSLFLQIPFSLVHSLSSFSCLAFLPLYFLFPFSFLIPLLFLPFLLLLSFCSFLPPPSPFFLSFFPSSHSSLPSYTNSFSLALTSFHSSSASLFPSTCPSFYRIGPLYD